MKATAFPMAEVRYRGAIAIGLVLAFRRPERATRLRRSGRQARMSNDNCLPGEAGGPGIILARREPERSAFG